MHKKQTIIGSKRVGKRKTLQTKTTLNDLYNAALCQIRPFGYLVCWTMCLFLTFLCLTFSSVCACFSLPSHAFGRAFCFSILCYKSCPVFPFCSLVFEKSTVSLWKLYFSNWFLVKASSSLLNGILQYQYIVTALKLIICNNIVYLCLQTAEMYLELKNLTSA